MRVARTGALTATLAAAVCAAALAQTSDLSGTWRLDRERSRVDDDVVFAGLIGAGVPETLHVTEPRNGTLVVESQINESYARYYVPGRTTTTPVFLGEAGTVTTTARREGRKLVAEGRREYAAGGAERALEVTETFGLDGESLEVEITLRGADGAGTSVLVYRRLDDVGTCETWPSPCKVPQHRER